MRRRRSRRQTLRQNPVQHVDRAEMVGPDRVVLESIDARRGKWVDAEALATPFRSPALKPGNYLVAPGRQLLLHMVPGKTECVWSEALFAMRKHNQWTLVFAGETGHATLDARGEIASHDLAPKELARMRAMLVPALDHMREQGLPVSLPARSSRRSSRRSARRSARR